MSESAKTETSGAVNLATPPEYHDNLPAAFRLWAKGIGLEMEVCLPCIVEEYNRTAHLARVRPLVKAMSLMTGERFDRDTFYATVWRFQVGGFLIDAPLFKGDTGWIIASDRNAESAKDFNNLIMEKDTMEEGEDDEKNAGPCAIPDGDETTHVFTSGFFIPDHWGSISVTEPTTDDQGNDAVSEDALVIRQQKPDGTSNCGVILLPSGEIRVRTHVEDELNLKESVITTADDTVKVERTTGFALTKGAPKNKTSSSVLLSEKGLTYEGDTTREQTVITAVRYDIDSHQVQVKHVIQKFAGDMLVHCSEESDWDMVVGGQAEQLEND